jgi:predicted TPR repeat methyltransferase
VSQKRQRKPISSKEIKTWKNQAESLLAVGKAEDADALFRNILKYDKENMVALRGIALAAGALGQKSRAVKFGLKADKQEAKNHCSNAEKASEKAFYQEAIECYQKAIEVDSDNLDAIWGLAECYASLDDKKMAAEWYQRYLDIEPDEPEAMHMLSAMGVSTPPDRASEAYISTLFDRFAPDFDAQLTGELEYRAPKILASTIKGHLTEEKNRLDILDLGCGTGLGGVAFKKLAKRIDGVDLSGEMLKLARKRRIYKHLTKSDIITHLNRVNRKYDLVTGADVFVYFGVLNALFAGVERILKPGGFLVFSVESNKNSSFELTPSGRYVHGRPYVRKVAKWGGLNECSVNREIVRQEYGEPVFGDIWVFKAHGERAS